MNLVSYSVWGNDPFYCEGLVENVPLIREYYPGYNMRVYHDNKLPKEIKERLQKEGVQLVEKEIKRGLWEGSFWRFLAAEDKDVEILLLRDADSRVNAREAAAVEEWLESGKAVHVMRDHLHHNVPMLAGMWGCKTWIMKSIGHMINAWEDDYDIKGVDQRFLGKVIWPIIYDYTLVHDKYGPEGILIVENEILPWEEVADYNPWDNCGDEKLPEFPIGRIILKDGRVLNREDVYEYRPKEYFNGETKKFPEHKPMKHGTFVGQQIKPGGEAIEA